MKMARIAAPVMVAVFSGILIFHLLIITGIIPYDIVWGGRLHSREEMIRFEVVSIALNIVCLSAVLLKLNDRKKIIPIKWINGILWGMALLFTVNTVGNLYSDNHWERIIFTPVTILLTIGACILARNKPA